MQVLRGSFVNIGQHVEGCVGLSIQMKKMHIVSVNTLGVPLLCSVPGERPDGCGPHPAGRLLQNGPSHI